MSAEPPEIIYFWRPFVLVMINHRRTQTCKDRTFSMSYNWGGLTARESEARRQKPNKTRSDCMFCGLADRENIRVCLCASVVELREGVLQ